METIAPVDMRSTDLSSNTTQIKGRVRSVWSPSKLQTSCWILGTIDTHEGLITFTAEFPVPDQLVITLYGQWVVHPRYGKQFKALSYTCNIDADKTGLARFIAQHPEIKGIGPVKAQQLIETGGGSLEDLFNMLDDDDIASKIKAPVESITRLREIYEREQDLLDTRTWLAGLGLTYKTVEKLIAIYGGGARITIQNNPYILADEVYGWGFRKADQVAQAIGFPVDSSLRVREALKYQLQQYVYNGDTCAGRNTLIQDTLKLLVLDRMDADTVVALQLGDLIDRGQLKECSKVSISGTQRWIALPIYAKAEEAIAHALQYATNRNPHRNTIQDVHLSTDLKTGQREFIDLALKYQITCLTGGAGVGKTYTIRELTRIYQRHSLSVTCCAPTGKAARRITQLTDLPAQTIHRLLGYQPDGTYAYAEDTTLDTDLIIVDEVSMVDSLLAAALFKAIDWTRTSLILVGDHNQIPSVGAGSFLRDITTDPYETVPHITLTEVIRQEGTLRNNSLAILFGNMHWNNHPVTRCRRYDWITTTCKDEADIIYQISRGVEMILDVKGEEAPDFVQVLSPVRQRGDTSTNNLNLILQRIFQQRLYDRDVEPSKQTNFYVGDKVIQTKNDYRLGVMNGTIGRVVHIENGMVVVHWEDNEVRISEHDQVANLDLAYALTIHKAQGSEFPIVFVVCHKSHAFMWHRNLLYTAVTRAQKGCVILGDKWGIRNAVETVRTDGRHSLLPLFL